MIDDDETLIDESSEMIISNTKKISKIEMDKNGLENVIIVDGIGYYVYNKYFLSERYYKRLFIILSNISKNINKNNVVNGIEIININVGNDGGDKCVYVDKSNEYINFISKKIHIKMFLYLLQKKIGDHRDFEGAIKNKKKYIQSHNKECLKNFGKSNLICVKHILTQKPNIFESFKKSKRKIKIKFSDGKFIKIVQK